jgi:transketolase
MLSSNLRYTTATPVRDGFGQALLELGAENPDVVAMGADLTSSIRAHWFAETYPDRFIQMGISENDMVGTAAGLSFTGYIPFLTTFSVFATSLANQAVRLSVAYNHANVKIAVSHGGITVGPDGATHQAFEDIALMRMLPGMQVVVPADANQAYDATVAAAAYDGPVFLRLARGDTMITPGNEAGFEIGRSYRLSNGSDVAILATGSGVELAVQAADRLTREGVHASVVNVSTVKPLDEETILQAVADCGAVVTVEEHSVLGGLGGAVSELLARRHPAPIEFVGVQDTFGESGEPEEIMNAYGITDEAVVTAARRVLKRVPA